MAADLFQIVLHGAAHVGAGILLLVVILFALNGLLRVLRWLFRS